MDLTNPFAASAEMHVAATEGDWLAGREHGIGSSEIADLFHAPWTLWAKKVGLPNTERIRPNVPEERLEIGHLMEPVARELLARRTGHSVSDPRAMIQAPDAHEVNWSSKERPWQRATPDSIVTFKDESLGVAELKNWDAGAKAMWEDNAPMKVHLQLETQLDVLGLERGYCCCLLGGNHFVFFEVERDPRVCEHIWHFGAEMWSRVTNGRAALAEGEDPHEFAPPEAMIEDMTALGLVWTSVPLKECEVEPEFAASLREAASLRKQAEEHFESTKAKAMRLMGDAEALVCGGTRVATWKTGKRARTFRLSEAG